MNASRGIRPRVLVVWVLLGALVVGIAILEYRNRSKISDGVAQTVHGAQGSRMLLPAPVEDLGAIELARAGTLHRFERDASGTWFYHGMHAGAQPAHAHQTDPAQAQVIEKAFAALARTRMERQFKLDVQATNYGLASPQMIILVYGKANAMPLAQFAVGDLAPDQFSRYVLPVGSAFVVTIADYQITSLLELIQAVGGGSAPARGRDSAVDRR